MGISKLLRTIAVYLLRGVLLLPLLLLRALKGAKKGKTAARGQRNQAAVKSHSKKTRPERRSTFGER